MQETAKEFPIEKMAKILKVSVSGYYAYLARRPSLREERNDRFVDVLKKIHQGGRKMYGSLRVDEKIKKKGNDCSRKRVARLMRENGIVAKMRKSWKKTTKEGIGAHTSL